MPKSPKTQLQETHIAGLGFTTTRPVQAIDCHPFGLAGGFTGSEAV